MSSHPFGRHRRSALSRSSWAGSSKSIRSMSACVLLQPTEIRIDRCASTPMAASTGDGSNASEEHDDPECTAIPAASSPITSG